MSNKVSKLIRLISLIFLGSVTHTAAANWQFGADVLRVASDKTKAVNVLVGVAGYQFKLSDKFSIQSDLSLGTGVKKRNVSGEGSKNKLKLTYYLSVSTLGRYQVTDNFFVVAGVIANKSRYKKTTKSGSTERNGKWRFGLNGGVGYQLNSAFSIGLSYGKTKDNAIWQAGLRYKF
ncbi:MAG: outer membrane protein assembly factor BamA [Alteromonadaceae bacterium]|jgi:outer membrane protein assembly factor BamA